MTSKLQIRTTKPRSPSWETLDKNINQLAENESAIFCHSVPPEAHGFGVPTKGSYTFTLAELSFSQQNNSNCEKKMRKEWMPRLLTDPSTNRRTSSFTLPNIEWWVNDCTPQAHSREWSEMAASTESRATWTWQSLGSSELKTAPTYLRFSG